MKLIEQDQLPGAVQCRAVGGGASLTQARHIINGPRRILGFLAPLRRQNERYRVEKLRIAQKKFRLAITPLVARLGGVRPAMELEIKFSHPNRQIMRVGPGLFEEIDDLFLLQLGEAIEVL